MDHKCAITILDVRIVRDAIAESETVHESRSRVDKLIGEQVIRAMQARSISSEEVATHLGVNRETVEAFCAGQSRMTASQLFALSELLGQPVAYFFLPAFSADDAAPPNRRLQ